MVVKMISRTLLIALCCAATLALSPLAPPNIVGDNSDCALYLNGPGRTSAYDYSINLLKGNFGYEGQPNCITFEAIDQAYLDARNRVLVSQPKGDWGAEDFGSVGELILDISINLARRPLAAIYRPEIHRSDVSQDDFQSDVIALKERRYGLTYEEIEKGLPLIDTSRTLIREVCPPVFSHVECRAGKYRRFDGLCNNLKNPTWGSTMAPFQRLIGPLFADGINAPRIAHHGRDLPLSRVVSRTMHPDEGFHDHAGTVMVIAWGQFMDHDYTLTGTPLDPINRNDPEECCKRPLHLKHPYCNEIRIPDDDYFYRLFGVKCIDFVRAFPSPRPGCRLGSRVPFNTLTGSLDGNTVYGVTEKFARKLRTGFGGLLRMNPVFKEYGLKDLLPLKLDIPDEGCTRPNKNMYCFEAGEIRVNEQLVLTVMHTLMAREHNRVANALAEVNPHWDDETLFQEARRINIAEIQHITYNEFLPILLGKDVMEKFGLVLAKEGFWDGYDTDVNPDVIDSFAAAAYRFGHSLLPTAVERWSKAHKFIASKRLSDLIRRPYDLYRAGVLDEYVMGLMNQVAQAMDDSITQEVTNHLFKKVGARFGMDLVSFNMQRGREFGLPGYMEFRKFCGLPPADTFQDLFGSMPNATVRKYETIFDHPIDVDLWSGGVSERPLPGSMLGPTFACIIATQFSYSRRGDRFWFELPNQPSSFTPEQLAEIRKSRLARIICDNTDIIDTTQLYPFVLPDHELNPRVPCRSGILPSMDFSKWAEQAPFHSSAKQFMTNATISVNNSSTNEEVNTADNKQEKVNNQTLVTQDKVKLSNDSNITASNITIANNEKDNNTSNDISKDDTILKYVYKKDEIQETNKTNTGHPKNSLKRRKRSAVHEAGSPLPARVVNPSVIVNYETSHGPEQADAVWLPIKAGKIVPHTDLADFKIVTEHINPKNNHNQPKIIEKESTEAESLSEASNESSEKEYKPNHEKRTYESEERSEPRGRNKYKDNHKDSSAESNSDESAEVNADIKSKRPYPQDDSREQYENSGNKKLSRQHSRYNNNKRGSSIESNSDESAEVNSEIKSKSSYPRDDSREQYDKNGNKKLSRQHSRYNNNKSHSSIESNSNESAEVNSPIKAKQSYSKDDSKEQYDSGENKKPSRQHSRYINNKRDSSAEFNSNESTERKSAIKNRHSYPHHNNREQYNSRENITSSDSVESEESSESNESKNKIYNERQHHDKLQDIQAPEPKDQSHETQRPNIERPDLEKYPTESSAKQSSAESEAQKSDEETKPSLSQDQVYKKEAKYPAIPIRDVDLGDFSYERIQVNEHGKVIPTKDSHDNHDPKSAVELISSTLKPEFITPDFITPDFISLAIQPVPIITNDKLENNKLIQINDGEVKPVVEISTEEDPGSSEEIDNINNENSSLESVLGVEVLENSNKENEKIVSQDNSKTEDIKQQVERIPLDYKHDKKENNVENVTQSSDPPNLDDINPPASVGTVDAFTPEDVPLDDKLNIKFDNLAFTLPEIKLPDDILAFTKLSSPFKEDEETKSKQSTYPYYEKERKAHESKNNEDDEDRHYYGHNEKIRKGKDEDDDHSYYGPKQNIRNSKNNDDDDNHDESDEDQNKGYYNYHEHVPRKEKYKKKHAEEEADEEEDLYEKFVRERFGKRGTFEKRNAKLEALPANPKLYQTLQKILKKTADIDEQAKKSGDPNAGYMWTLEYGENL